MSSSFFKAFNVKQLDSHMQNRKKKKKKERKVLQSISLHYISNSEWFIELNVRAKTIKLLEKNRRHFSDSGLSRTFSKTQKP